MSQVGSELLIGTFIVLVLCLMKMARKNMTRAERQPQLVVATEKPPPKAVLVEVEPEARSADVREAAATPTGRESVVQAGRKLLRLVEVRVNDRLMTKACPINKRGQANGPISTKVGGLPEVAAALVK